MSKHRVKTKIDSAAGVATYQHVRESFARQGLMKHLVTELTALDLGKCEIRVRHDAELTRQHGLCGLHHDGGGFQRSRRGIQNHSVAPAEGDLLIARGRVLRSGRTLKICAADVFVVEGKQEILCATSLSTIMALLGPSDSSRSRRRAAK